MMHKERINVGWIIGDLPHRAGVFRRVRTDIGGVSLARYDWLMRHVNARPAFGIRHERHVPRRRYDVVIFLKTMGGNSMETLAEARRRGARILFDVNVNYFERDGAEYYEGMLPTARQQADTIEMARAVDGVIADSSFLESVSRRYSGRVKWIPDNVELAQIPPYRPSRIGVKPLQLLWSGEAVKLFEFLSIEDVLRRYAPWIELVFVTNTLAALDRWHPPYRERFQSLLRYVPHRIVPFRSIAELFDVYAQGGVLISPRFLDNSYNLGHTEWKITLGMACGRMAMCSPLPSYLDVAERSGGRGIRVCETPEDWERALDALLSGGIVVEEEEGAARNVVEAHYSTRAVARMHSLFLKEVVRGETAADPGAKDVDAGMYGAARAGDRR